MLFEVKLRVERENSKGELKKVTEHYIIDGCELFAEAELRAIQEYNEDCEVFYIAQSKITEIINEKQEDKPFFKATVVSVFVDDDGAEKETTYPVLVCAKDINEANKLMDAYLKQGMTDMHLNGIVKTKIVDMLT